MLTLRPSFTWIRMDVLSWNFLYLHVSPEDFREDCFLVVPGPDVETRRIDCVQEANLAGNVKKDAVLARVPVPEKTIRH
jgi:hypothetical protein